MLNTTDIFRPARLDSLLRKGCVYLAAGSAVTLCAGIWLSFFFAPPDYLQGESVRIMFVHVPNAWWASAFWFGMALCALMYLVRRHVLWAMLGASLAPAGAVCVLSALVTGAIWGRPTWGTFWQWGDARIITTFVLGLFYLAYLLIPQAVERSSTARRVQAYCALIGTLNLPLIRFSVDWWQTLHQPASVLRLSAPAMHWSFLLPLLVMVAAVGLLCLLIAALQLRRQIGMQRLERITREGAPSAVGGG